MHPEMSNIVIAFLHNSYKYTLCCLLLLCISQTTTSANTIDSVENNYWTYYKNQKFKKASSTVRNAFLRESTPTKKVLRYKLLYALSAPLNRNLKKAYKSFRDLKETYEEEINNNPSNKAITKIVESKFNARGKKFKVSYDLLIEANSILSKEKEYPLYGIVQTKLANAANLIHKNSKEINQYIEEAVLHYMNHQDTLHAIRTLVSLEMKANGYINTKLITFYEEALRLGKLKQLDNSFIGTIYLKLGKAYRRTTNFGYANANYENGVRLLSNDSELKNSRLLTNLKYNQAHNYNNMHSPEKALELYEEVLEIYKERSKGLINIAEVELQLSNTHKQLKQYEKALELAISCYETRKKILKNKDHWIILRALKQVGEIYLLKGDFKNAERCLKEVLAKTKLQNRKVELSSSYSLMQTLEKLQGNYSKAQAYNDSSLLAIDYNFDQLAIEQYEGEVINNTMLIVLLQRRIDLYNKLYLQTKDPNYLFKGRTQIKSSLKMFDEVLVSIADQEARLNIYKVFYTLFDDSMDLYHSLVNHQPDEDIYFKEALLIAEKSRDVILREKILKKELFEDNQIKQLLVDENKYVQIIEDLEVEKFKTERNFNPLESKITKIENQIFQNTKKLNKIKATLQKSFKEKLHYDLDQKNFQVIEESLDLNTHYVAFFYGEQSIYKLEIRKGKKILSKKELDPNFEEKIQAFHKSLSQEFNQLEKWKTFATEIYSSLFNTNQTFEERIKFIPDGPLASIPFEILINPNTEKMLIEEHLISYANSFSSYAQFSKRKNTASKGFAGFAPEYKQFDVAQKDTFSNTTFALLVRSGNYALPGAQEEVNKICKLVDGDKFLKDASNKQQFLKSAEKYNVLHLSMHALLESNDPEFSRLLFNQSKLNSTEDYSMFVNELSNLDLNAQLAVLSACNTGSGSFKKGEGKVSLSRAFNYAGVPSTVHSLWKVPDETTSAIMLDFYKSLKSGNNIDEALRSAKLAFLANNVIPERAHPFYWAGFILDGKINPVDFVNRKSFPWLLSIGLAISLLIALGIFLKFRSN